MTNINLENEVIDKNNEMFENILDKDEKIEKVFKPNKVKMFWSVLIKAFLNGLWAVGCFIAIPIGAAFGEDMVDSTGEVYRELNGTAFLIGLAAGIVLTLLVVYIFYRLAYKNTYYAYSSKRLIIRKGIFGIDYKSLDLKMVGAFNVNVSLLDKLVRKNTGSITYGSMSNPIAGVDNTAQLFRFSHIENPYVIYKEIKAFADNCKNAKTEK